MSGHPRPAAAGPLPDAEARVLIRSERARNLLVIAGAGTGKTTSIIDRVAGYIAPRAPGDPAVTIDRLAVITFTRRAAGELRFGMRERILKDLRAEPDGERAERLRAALTGLDTAAISTIHSFADRLLRLRPIEAKLSPAYALAEENDELVRETFRRLRLLAESGELAADLAGARVGSRTLSREELELAQETLRAVTQSGLQIEARENAFGFEVPSLASVVSGMIEQRDVRVALPPIPDAGLAVVREAVGELVALEARVRGSSVGAGHLRNMISRLRQLAEVESPVDALAVIKEALGGRRLQWERDFEQDNWSWTLYKTLRGEQDGGHGIPRDLGPRLRRPYRWLATRIVHLAPVAVVLYDRVKAERERVDYVDLLIKLRDLLRDQPDVRRYYQQRFDHIFVDEFQDTDPLQCEILFYLCEDGTSARDWSEVHLRPGRLTLVGDPKQSIYRFRRADVATYARAEAMLRDQGALVLSLVTNFRSRPELVRYFNARLAVLLNRDAPPARGRRPMLDAATGQVFYERIEPDPAIPAGPPPVHVIPYAGAGGEGLPMDEGRAAEAAAIASYLAWLLRTGGEVRDQFTKRPRRLRPGDIAILAPVTTRLNLLRAELDARGIEHSIRGGTLLLSHPVVRRYLLALRAIADRDDGVAEAALFAPPIFALDPLDLVLERIARRRDTESAADAESAVPAAEREERIARVAAAREIVRDLRARRHGRSPGATARDLIERTGLGRAVQARPNGRQTLAALYEVAFEIERRAQAEGLDFDQATRLPRDWADVPVFLPVPEPLGDDAVRIMTVHQAKGLEFPVVVLWDGYQTVDLKGGRARFWVVGRDGRSWALNLSPVTVEEPEGSAVAETEKGFDRHERARLYYVAATRARDLLVLPLPRPVYKWDYATAIMAGAAGDRASAGLVHWLAPYQPDAIPDWARPEAGAEPVVPPPMRADPEFDRVLAAGAKSFATGLARSMQPRAAPRAVTAVAHAAAAAAAVEDEIDPAAGERAAKSERSRHGQHFGIAVHRALELVLGGADLAPEDAVRVAIEETGLALRPAARRALAALHGDVEADVGRALAALDAAGLRTLDLATEVDVTAVPDDATLLRGAIDLLAVGPDVAYVIDWKTDQPVRGALATAYPAYAEQLRLYAAALRAAGWLGGPALRAGLLLTATGEIRWLD